MSHLRFHNELELFDMELGKGRRWECIGGWSGKISHMVIDSLVAGTLVRSRVDLKREAKKFVHAHS